MNLERGGYFVGPSKYPKHMDIWAVTVDLSDAREPHSAEEAVAVALVSIQGMVRGLYPDSIVKTADLVAELGGMPTASREKLRDLLNYMDERDGNQGF